MNVSIHRVIFDKDDRDELYIRGRHRLSERGELCLNVGESISADTYFNSFSLGKWIEYTGLSNLKFHLRAKGCFDLKVYHAAIDEIAATGCVENGCDGGGGVTREVVFEGSYDLTEESDIDVSLPESLLLNKCVSGVCYFVIDNVTRDSYFLDICYRTDCADESLDQVRLAINICTFRRQDCLYRNVDLLRTVFLSHDTDNSELSDIDLEIFITDNASEIPVNRFGDDRIHVFHGRNLGGAGGFTNGLIEVLNARDRSGFTHILFMDDDAEIIPESIRRTYYLLKLVRAEYKEYFIAGAMLNSGRRNIQHENGALWNMSSCRYSGRGLDLSIFENVLLNQLPSERDYAAWWYCCMPLDTISLHNLPAPFFIHGDDIEYSLRLAKGLITMNGIAVWHPVAEHRRLSSNEYYNLRNALVINAIYCSRFGFWKTVKKVTIGLGVAYLRHRYKDLKQVEKSVTDYLKGTSFFETTDPASLNEEIREMGYSFTDVSDALKNCKGSYYMNVHPYDLIGKGDFILYDDADNMGLILPQKNLEFFHTIGILIKLFVLILIRNAGVKRDYRANWNKLTEQEFWNRWLDCDNR